MATEFKLFRRRQLKHLLEPRTNLHQSVLPTCLTSSPGPQANSVEALSDVDHHAHDLVVVLVFQRLSYGRELSMEPEFVDADQFLVLEYVRPLAAVLVLWVFPLGSHTLLEEMVIGFEREI